MALGAATKQALTDAATAGQSRSKAVEAVLDEVRALTDRWGGATVAAGLQAATLQALAASDQPARSLARAAALELAALRAVNQIHDHLTDLANVGVNTHAQIDAELGFFNGSFRETFDAVATSDGSTVTMSLEQRGGGDLFARFSDGEVPFGSTPAATIVLTAGTDEVPVDNYVCILQSDKILTVSTSWPAAEHIKIGHFYTPSAAFVQTHGGVYSNQNYNDHAQETAGDGIGQGHMTDLSLRSRRFGAVWLDGCEGIATQDGDELYLSIAVGVVMQMHEHAFAAVDSSPGGGGSPVLVVNDFDTKNLLIDSLNDIDKLSDGTNLANNKYVKFVLMGVASKGGELQLMLVNVPSGQYNTAAAALRDVDGHANFTIPIAYGLNASTGFLVAAFVCQHTAGGMILDSTIDLRGTTPATAPGSGTGGGDVSAAAALADNAVILGDGGAKDVKGSGILVDGSNNMSGMNNLTLSGTVDGVDIAAHAADTTDPHGATMTVSTEVVTPKIRTVGNIILDAYNAGGSSVVTVANTAAQGLTLLVSGNCSVLGDITVTGTVDGVDVAARDHAESHTVVSHSDTTATGAELETLTDGSDADGLHKHDKMRTITKILYIENPLATDEFPIAFVADDVTMVQVRGVTDVGTVDFNIEYRSTDAPDSAGGLNTLADDLQATSGGASSTTFVNDDVPAERWLVYAASAIASSPTKLWVVIEYTID